MRVCLTCVCQVVSDSVTPWTVAHQAPLSMEFPRQEYLSGLPFPSPGDLPDPGIKPASPVYPALAGGFFTTSTAVINKLTNRGGGIGSPWLRAGTPYLQRVGSTLRCSVQASHCAGFSSCRACVLSSSPARCGPKGPWAREGATFSCQLSTTVCHLPLKQTKTIRIAAASHLCWP